MLPYIASEFLHRSLHTGQIYLKTSMLQGCCLGPMGYAQRSTKCSRMTVPGLIGGERWQPFSLHIPGASPATHPSGPESYLLPWQLARHRCLPLMVPSAPLMEAVTCNQTAGGVGESKWLLHTSREPPVLMGSGAWSVLQTALGI
jgi:hypothetical protein